MSTTVPGTAPVFTVLADDVDDVLADHQNTPNDSITAIATFLGMIGSGLTQASSTDLLGYISKARNSFRLTYSSGTTVVASIGEIVCTDSGLTKRVARKNTVTTNITSSNIDVGGAFGNNQTYYVYAIADSVATSVTFSVSTSSSAPSSATIYGMVGKFATDGSGLIISSTVMSYCGERVLQTQYADTTAVATGTTAIPNDDSIPQIGEGDLFLTLPYVPYDVSNLLVIEVSLSLSNATADQALTCALFQDSTVNALRARQQYSEVNSGSTQQQLLLIHQMLAGTVSKTTFTVRAGGASGTTTLNGCGGARKMGGVMGSYIKITEYQKVYL